MNALGVTVLLMAASPLRFERHEIDRFPAGYQAAVADLNGDGKPDVVALSTDANRVDWYENPTWKRRTIARTQRNIDLAVRDVDGDGKPEIALASGFHFDQADRGGEIQLLKASAHPDEPWSIYPIGADPVTHRLRWGDLEGAGRPVLVHAPIFGPGSKTSIAPKPSHLWAFRPPTDLRSGQWEIAKIDETLTVLHGLWVGDLDGDRRDEILTASFEGIYRLDFEGGAWRKTRIGAGASPISDKPGAARGSSEVAPGHFGPNRPFVAAIEPWHGHQVVVYTPQGGTGLWHRRVIDESLVEGHALVVADFDGDGQDEIVAGWRGGDRGLRLYDPLDPEASQFRTTNLDRGIAVEGAVVADLNADGRPDLVVIAGRTNDLVWYENQAR